MSCVEPVLARKKSGERSRTVRPWRTPMGVHRVWGIICRGRRSGSKPVCLSEPQTHVGRWSSEHGRNHHRSPWEVGIVRITGRDRRTSPWAASSRASPPTPHAEHVSKHGKGGDMGPSASTWFVLKLRRLHKHIMMCDPILVYTWVFAI